jgi:hypothetical protein
LSLGTFKTAAVDLANKSAIKLCERLADIRG